jgi:radical SAM protein with 4Fe4S-binding SPASM domain
MKENIHQIDALKELATDLGITFQYDLTVTPKHTGDLSPLRHRPSDDQLQDFLRDRISADTFTPYPYNENARFCSIGMNSFDLGPYGDVYTCVGARITAGNVRQTSMAEIWDKSPVWSETSSLTMGNLPVCSACELRQFCVRCHGTAAFEDGDLLGCSSIAYREARLRRKAYLDNGGH